MGCLHILTFLSLAVVVSHAAVSPETYWKSVLPNTPMPKAVSDLLPNDKSTDIHVGVGKGGTSVHAPGTNVGIGGKGGVSIHAPGTNVGIGKGGVSVNAPGTNVGVGKGGSIHTPITTNIGISNDVSVNAPGTHVTVGKGGVSVNAPGTNVGVGKGGVSVHAPGTTNVGVNKDVSVHTPGTHVGVGNGGVSVHAPGTNVGVGKGGTGVTVHAPQPKPKGDCTKVTVGKKGVVVRCHHKQKPVHVKVDPFLYKYAATDDQLKDDPNVALFFLEKEIRHGNSMNLHFTKVTSQKSTFLPREVADKIPFSSKKLPELYTRFSIEPDTIESESMKKTIKECEDKDIEGEKKFCATSLEAMVDFSTFELGKNVKAVSTEVNSIKRTSLQKYTIEGAKKLDSNQVVVCHKQKYPYAVFYCHKTTTTKAYAVSLVGEDATKVKAVAVCHTDTAKWNPKHLAFRVLNVKPGTTPVCHFLPEDHVVWVPNY
ncbi:BURP domain protein RD22-like [Rutidosis leptorrhynchoides]|uniref:BURP domain protein RD22-like n=1 Tax=Rutidosis leptorrhynchoides TaxID=125765 RepID=UPI003A9A309D